MDLVVEAEPPGRGKAVVPTLAGMLGDVDNSGRVDMDDGLLVAMHRVDSSLSLPNYGQIGLGDVDCNGRVERADAALIATFVVNPSASAVSSLRIGQRGGYSLNPVTEMVWGSILGTEEQDATVARLLDEVPVLVSGVFDIDGRDHLYLGIDRSYYQRHGGEHIYNTLKERFPITPLFVEALRRDPAGARAGVAKCQANNRRTRRSIREGVGRGQWPRRPVLFIRCPGRRDGGPRPRRHPDDGLPGIPCNRAIP